MSSIVSYFLRFFFCQAVFNTAFFLIISLLASTAMASPENEKRLADRAYEQRDTETAIKGYEKAFAQGYQTELMLYRMAFLYEQQEKYAQSIFFLKKIQFLYGGEWLMPKIQQLIELQNGFSRIPPSYPPALRVWLNEHQYIAIVAIVSLLALTAFFAFFRNLHWQRLWLTASALVAVSGCVMVLLYEYQRPNRVVLVQKTPCYQEPSYVLIKPQDSPSPGITLDITAEQDIWFRIGNGRYAYWIPKKIARNL